jgi:hypothetical protein
MKHLFILLIILFTITVNQSNAQGCVAIRSNGNTCSLGKAGDSKGYIFNFNTRYFKSYKHFVGKEEQKHRVEEGTEVINHSLSWDFTLTKMLNKYWSLSVNLPIISNVRSSMYEHYGNSSLNPNARNNTQSFGIGDIRFTAYRWVLDPAKNHNGNLQVGLSIKFATGDYEVTDYFHKLKSNGGDSTVLGPVDQSIQLGDGGTGIALELSGYRNFGARFGHPHLSITQIRCASFRETFRRLAPETEPDIYYPENIAASEELVFSLFKQGKEYDVIFCMGDLILIGTMHAVHELDLKVPDKIGIISISNGLIPTLYKPKITYVETSGHKLGRLAYSQMQACLEQQTIAEEIFVDAIAVEGGSL